MSVVAFFLLVMWLFHFALFGTAVMHLAGADDVLGVSWEMDPVWACVMSGLYLAVWSAAGLFFLLDRLVRREGR